MKKFLFFLFSLILIGLVWFYSDLWMDKQGMVNDQKETAQTLEEVNEEKAALSERLAKLKEEGQEKDQTIKRLEKDLEAALAPPLLTLSYKEPDASSRFLAEAADLFFLPQLDQALLASLDEGTLVQVVEETTNLDTGRVFLYVEVPAQPAKRGYILKEKTVYFTPDLEKKVILPVSLGAASQVTRLEEGEEGETLSLEVPLKGRLLETKEGGEVRFEALDGQVYRAQATDLIYPKSAIS